jgi:glycosyltransferase involved in cell wall biosynthesis
MKNSVLIIAAPFPGYYLTGFRKWLLEGTPPEGMPAVVNFLRETAKLNYQVHITLPVLGQEYPCKPTERAEGIVVHPYRIPACFYPLIKLLRIRGNFLLNFLFIILTILFSFGFHTRLLRSIQPAFIYQMGYNILLGYLLGRCFGYPLVYRLFGTGLWKYLDSAGCIKLNLWERFRSIPERFIYRHPGNLIVMSNDGTRGDKVMKAFGVPSERTLFVMNGVGYKGQRKSNLNIREGLGENTFLAVTVTRLVGWKGVDRTIKAFPRAVKKDPRLRLAIVGDGVERKNLEQMVENLGMGRYINFYGSIPHDMVIETIRQADVLVSTQYVTNRSNCTLEAVMANRPVVSLDDGSLDGFLQNMEDSLLVDPEKIDQELPDALVRLAGDRKLYEKLKKGIKKTHSQMRTWNERIRYELEVIENRIRSN